MGTDWNKMADNAKTRSDMYGLLTLVFRQEPSEAFINELRGPRLSGAFSDMELDMGGSFYSEPVSAIADQLALEFSRLFIGPGRHISAHESIFTEVDGDSGGLWGARTVEVKKFIETTGLDYASQFTGLPDHISVELEFMQKLADWEADKWIEMDRISAEYCLSIQRMFLQQHILGWIPKFCDAVIAQADIPFYRELAELTKNFLKLEERSLIIDTAA
ncbi:MAG: molecular chaperone TorD family protein [Candidatus Thiodiazotropha sp. (ex Lucina aurantia)]|uniref:Molecular chaperone TorD family protein n=1 Tax=Candidatus Thiodiazotropha taylori TaxID=2792791 RepID=A0A9E4NMB4_9GAMM|nr:molecular chaperone TorD family protein [Candidatus Thiodiazotropha sp. (ex Lucina pensylvanica)]MBT3021728.1 molecular chaperone TorD family protein [Candidatus Thiodiazotropha taylori]MBT3037888.1 molecular chaperone TorD family protein [Candidatus Thiodiazotropha sp. (ex Codakia orbicularis)]MBV2102513.1 molecular chaperone TorD family protein [Candidatus Thiodiazotropha sp. (ex Lucina aurantia)]MCW4237571.1 molecular chaperone TorD family protein [Candidatus Thiodiazotropha endolucinida]